MSGVPLANMALLVNCPYVKLPLTVYLFPFAALRAVVSLSLCLSLPTLRKNIHLFFGKLKQVHFLCVSVSFRLRGCLRARRLVAHSRMSYIVVLQHPHPTNNAALINFPLSSDAEIFCWLAPAEHTNWCQTCRNVYAMCIDSNWASIFAYRRWWLGTKISVVIFFRHRWRNTNHWDFCLILLSQIIPTGRRRNWCWSRAAGIGKGERERKKKPCSCWWMEWCPVMEYNKSNTEKRVVSQ